MKKYKILQDTVANRQKVHAGDIVELSEHEGHTLCAYNKAEEHIATPKAKKADRSVGLKSSDAKPLKKKGK